MLPLLGLDTRPLKCSLPHTYAMQVRIVSGMPHRWIRVQCLSRKRLTNLIHFERLAYTERSVVCCQWPVASDRKMCLLGTRVTSETQPCEGGMDEPRLNTVVLDFHDLHTSPTDKPVIAHTYEYVILSLTPRKNVFLHRYSAGG